jgi:hypothetical protein
MPVHKAGGYHSFAVVIISRTKIQQIVAMLPKQLLNYGGFQLFHASLCLVSEISSSLPYNVVAINVDCRFSAVECIQNTMPRKVIVCVL